MTTLKDPASDTAGPPPASSFASRTHIDALDGVRGLACLLVVFDHLAGALGSEFHRDTLLIRVVRSGWIGVDLFFVLSGFLITGILYESRRSEHYFKNFYARRTLRIFPLYFGVLGLVLLRSLAFPGATYGTLGTQWWLWTYLSNVGVALYDFPRFAFLGHFWSLAVEEHFYLVWPFLVLYLSRKNLIRWALVIAIGAFVARTIVVVSGIAPNPNAVYVLTPFRADALALGGVLALAVRGPSGIGPFLRPARWIIPIAAAGLAVLASMDGGYLNQKAPLVQTVGFTLIALLSVAIVILVLSPGLPNRLMSHPSLRWVGKYSYGMYVWHPIVMQAFYLSAAPRLITNDRLRAVTTAVFFLSMVPAVSLASWHLWEKHFLKLKRHFE